MNRVFRRAAELVRRGWTRGRMAADGDGNTCDSLSLFACRWCVHGAIRRAAHELGQDEEAAVQRFTRHLRERLGSPWETITGWNDTDLGGPLQAAQVLEDACAD